jgi:5-formyltetrahydrofolate cyclo-ligase
MRTESQRSKSFLRNFFKKKLSLLPLSRREEVSFSLLVFSSLLSDKILSFSSFRSEINTFFLNSKLAKEGRLLLPKICGQKLRIYHVKDLKNDLLPNPLGFSEPNPKFCKEAHFSEISTILVPALAFDNSYHRLGYGGGFYDRFLKNVPNAQSIGIGFKEQFFERLPFEENDIPLLKLSLF